MKRFLLAVLFVCCASLVYAQNPMQDVVYLKNGSVVKGTVLPSAEGTVKIQTRDGSIFVYNSNDVASRNSEQVTQTVTGKKILDYPKHSFGIRGGALFSIVPQSDMLLNPEKHQVSNSWEEEPEYELLTLNGAGFHIGGVYEVALTKTNRWFFQTGLDLQYINTIKKKSVYVEDLNSWNDDDCWNFQNLTANSLFIDIPMMFSCKFPLGKGFGIYPSFGITHTIGLYSRLSGEREGLDHTSTTDGLQPFEIKGFRTDYETEEYSRGTKEQPLHYQLSPYSRYHLNFRAELNFIIKNNIVLGINTSFVMLNSSMDGLFSGDSQLWCNIGLSVGYNF